MYIQSNICKYRYNIKLIIISATSGPYQWYHTIKAPRKLFEIELEAETGKLYTLVIATRHDKISHGANRTNGKPIARLSRPWESRPLAHNLGLPVSGWTKRPGKNKLIEKQQLSSPFYMDPKTTLNKTSLAKTVAGKSSISRSAWILLERHKIIKAACQEASSHSAQSIRCVYANLAIKNLSIKPTC